MSKPEKRTDATPKTDEAKAIAESEKAFAEASLSPVSRDPDVLPAMKASKSSKVVVAAPVTASEMPAKKIAAASPVAKKPVKVLDKKPEAAKVVKAKPARATGRAIARKQAAVKTAPKPAAGKSKPVATGAPLEITSEVSADLGKDTGAILDLADKNLRKISGGLEAIVAMQQELMASLADSTLASLQNFEVLGDSIMAQGERLRDERARFMSDMLSARTPEDVMRAQEAYITSCYGHMVSGFSSAADTVNRLSRETTDPFSAQFSRLLDRLWMRAA